MTDVSQTGFATASLVGTGMMGPGIALTLALGGIRATLLSHTADRAAQGVAKARAQGRVARMDALARPDALLASNTSGLRELRTPGRGRARSGVRSSRRPEVLDASRASGRASASMRATRPCALAFATPCAARSAVWLSRVARIPPRASVRAIPGPIIPVPTRLAVANPVCDTSVILPACAPPGWRAANHGKGVDLVLARSTRTLEQ